MIEIRGRDLSKIEDAEQLERDGKALKYLKYNSCRNQIEQDYFEFLNCISLNDYSVENIKFLRMYIDFLKNRC